MGYYIDKNTKGDFLVQNHKGESLVAAGDALPYGKTPTHFDEAGDQYALVVEVFNGPFSALGYAFSDSELRAMTMPEDHRPKIWYIMDKADCYALSGYRERA